MISDDELQASIYALSEVVNEDVPPAIKKKEMEKIFDEVISKEILPRASDEQIKRFYNWFTTFYNNICHQAGESPRKDLINEDTWLSCKDSKLYGIAGYQINSILMHMDKIKKEDELEKYYEYIKNEIYPFATPTQIRKIMSKYDQVMKRIQREREYLEINRKLEREIEAIKEKLDLRKGKKIEIDGMQGEILDISSREILVKWNTGFKNWIDIRTLIEE